MYIYFQVGDVAYVELFNDENGKPRGCGVVEFSNTEAMKKALFVMHRYELNGRKLVLKEETGTKDYFFICPFMESIQQNEAKFIGCGPSKLFVL